MSEEKESVDSEAEGQSDYIECTFNGRPGRLKITVGSKPLKLQHFEAAILDRSGCMLGILPRRKPAEHPEEKKEEESIAFDLDPFYQRSSVEIAFEVLPGLQWLETVVFRPFIAANYS